MKILHLMLASFYIDNYSYQENYLPKHHMLQGHDVQIVASLFTFDENGKGKWLPHATKYINENGIAVSRLAFAKSPAAKRLRYYIGLQEELEHFSPDLIFIHGVQFMDIRVVAKYCKMHPAVRVYVDNHADFSNSATNWLSKHILHHIFWRNCARTINPYTTKFYGVLPARVDFLIQEYNLPKQKVELLIMGADDAYVQRAANHATRSAIRKKYALADDDFLIITGGKIDAFKTQTLLLMQAVHNIDNDKIKLLVFGSVSPELADKVTALADGQKVQYIGWIDSKDSYDYFAASDLAVFPGRHSVFWEQAAAQSLPLLVKRWDGTTHVNICDNAVFLEKDSAEEITEKVLQIMRNYPHYHSAAKQASEQFLYSKIAQKSIAEDA